MGKKGKKPQKQEVNTKTQPSPEPTFPGSLAPAPALAREAMTESPPKQDHPPELDLEDFPPLIPPSGAPQSRTKKQLFVMIIEVKADLEELKANHEELEANHEQLKVFGHHWSRNDLIFCAAEILK
ncbi:unnamed protein product [Sphagnum tenellum]